LLSVSPANSPLAAANDGVLETAASRRRGTYLGDPSVSVDADTVRRITHLARIAVAEHEVEHLKDEINSVLAFVEQLSEVDIAGIEPMTSVTPMAMKKRPDVVTDGGIPDDIVKNAPAVQGHFFLVPKVVE
jgi:aspartyl-tRNA(Asn)/glutamyl-tRNA(Gln) amidotransferase subunit C